MGGLRRDEGDGAGEVLRRAGTELGLALAGAMSTSLPLAITLAIVSGGRAFADGIDSRSAVAEVAALRRYVFGLGRRLREEHGWTDERLQEFLRHPATLRLLAQARDEYAVDQMQPNLERLAAVIAGRGSRENDALDDDLRFARAAVAIPDVGVLLLCVLVDRRARNEFASAAPQLDGPIEDRSIPGETASTQLLRSRSWQSLADAERGRLSIQTLVEHGLVMETDSIFFGKNEAVGCEDGHVLRFAQRTWVVTELGVRFACLVRDAGNDGVR